MRLVLAATGLAAAVAAAPVRAQEPAESRLVDVSIAVFEPASDLFPEARRAEARFLPVQLARALQATGRFGAVRVVPDADTAEVAIRGRVLESHGARLTVEIVAEDVSGKRWLKERYREKADASAYLGRDRTEDPFAELFQDAAKDLVKKLRKVKPEERRELREIARLRFAESIAPAIFGGYLSERRGRLQLARLPAEDDPMMARLDRIRPRDRMFVDTVDAHYRDLYARMLEPYRGWQSEDYFRREAMKNGPPSTVRTGGRNAPLGVLIPGQPGTGAGPVCGTPGLFGGRRTREADERRWAEEKRRSHLDILRELGASLAADVAPHVVEIDGRVLRLEGSVEAQLARWREILREIFEAETGLAAPAAPSC